MKRILLIALMTVLIGCQEVSKKKSDQPSWSQQMKSMAEEVSELIPYVYNRKEFNNSQNHKIIQNKIDKITNTAHNIPLKYSEKYLGNDPLIKYSAQNLKKDLSRASAVFKNGNKSYARTVLKNSLNHCFRCHTRNQFGPEYLQWKISFEKMNIPPTSKAQLFIATRQYQKAHDSLEFYLSQKYGVYSKPLEQEKALKLFLSLAVRVEKQPKKIIKVLKKTQDNEAFPTFLKESLHQWVKSLNNWSQERNPHSISFEKANILIAKAKSIREFQSLDLAHVEYLRASSILHELLNNTKNNKQRAQIFYLLGESYDVLSESGFWELPELYYESCVREWPKKSQLSKQCFIGYERNVILGYSGSIGILIPQIEKEKLLELKKLAGLE